MKFEIASINVITEDFGPIQDDFWINIEIDITKSGDYGAESFSANVVSVKRLERITESNPALGRGMIICKENEENAIRNIVQRLIEKSTADSWEEFCLEFEKYFDRI
jgi:hypothetical protein